MSETCGRCGVYLYLHPTVRCVKGSRLVSEPLSAKRLAEIRARADAVTTQGGRFWDLFSAKVESQSDVPDLLAEVDRLQAENARLATPKCGGPDCRMTELHTVNTCPTYEAPAVVYGEAEMDAWYDEPDLRYPDS